MVEQNLRKIINELEKPQKDGNLLKGIPKVLDDGWKGTTAP